MQPVSCGRCGSTVLVSKYSAEQTSIQWQGDSSDCPQRHELPLGDTCPALSDAIADAVRGGTLEVSLREQ